ncbi:SDR family NAD(P)-dependent oxidoreductase [Hymenobacter aerilatus]|uniref:SDR family NAD(P)-dependent oxidoreductase n=1 Tax=Hymenobacter aerilatus TaxID=2932251 RepID=A0A8T9SY84_9BACT|nr:SDR family NAD(P)-dependent oxidoreductase [Hymenobacter aerilatus]UOR06667.1 SDR family NAD(P)-dependent oxidoreductase [Hymenobacter aerilatus]
MENKKIALVSGGNKGIGLAIVRGLLQAGCQVYLGAREVAKGQQAAAELAAEGDVRVIELDLNNQATLDAATARVQREVGHLDILVNNAGINVAGDGLPSTAAIQSVEQVLQTNFVGTLAVTQAFLPLLRQAAAGRIVNVSSPLGSLTLSSQNDWGLLGYSASKAALNMLTVQLAHELRDTAIKINSASPGYTATDLNDFAGTDTPEQGAAEAIRLALLPADGPSGTSSSSAASLPW